MSIKFISHTADIQFKVSSKSLDKAFEEVVEGFSKSVCEDEIKKKVEKKIKVNGNDLKSLLYNFVEELVVLFDSEYFLTSKVKEIKVDEDKMKLECVLAGDLAGNYNIHSHVKSITYNDMIVKKEKGNWIIQITLDV